MSFVLKRREDRIAFPDERRKLREALMAAQDKLKIYRANASGEYVGGMEYNALMNLIDEALNA